MSPLMNIYHVRTHRHQGSTTTNGFCWVQLGLVAGRARLVWVHCTWCDAAIRVFVDPAASAPARTVVVVAPRKLRLLVLEHQR